MSDSLITYLHDHLSGARFAVSLLKDLETQSVDRDAVRLAEELLPPIDHDRTVLEAFAERFAPRQRADLRYDPSA